MTRNRTDRDVPDLGAGRQADNMINNTGMVQSMHDLTDGITDWADSIGVEVADRLNRELRGTGHDRVLADTGQVAMIRVAASLGCAYALQRLIDADIIDADTLGMIADLDHDDGAS